VTSDVSISNLNSELNFVVLGDGLYFIHGGFYNSLARVYQGWLTLGFGVNRK
jgi:hypothetical protein